jgi:hypothetical protein
LQFEKSIFFTKTFGFFEVLGILGNHYLCNGGVASARGGFFPFILFLLLKAKL